MSSSPGCFRRNSPEAGIISSRFAFTLAAVLSVIFAAAMGIRAIRTPRQSVTPLPAGYISDSSVLTKEYSDYHGRLMSSPELEEQFQQATASVAGREYTAALVVLESAAKRAGLPVLFNNLGVVYEQVKEHDHAIQAFREALARDIHYAPVRSNLNRISLERVDEADPFSQEAEPNDTNRLANVIAVDFPVTGEIRGLADVDCFRFIAPRAPRDVLSLQIENHSPTLEIETRLYDNDQRAANTGASIAPAGTSVLKLIAPPPNSAWYLQVSATRGTSGPYTLKVHAMKAYDAFEPNDDIFSATKITIGQTVEANIMDDGDTDYYAFETEHAGKVTIRLQNHSNTLVPALTTFTPDRRNSGFGPDIRTPGDNLLHTLPVEANQTYFLQVWSPNSTAGRYSLTIEQ